MFLAALPLAYEPSCYVEITREYRLTSFLTHADLPNFFGAEILDLRQADLVKILHRLLVYDARVMRANRCHMHGSHRITAILLTHGIRSP